MSVATWFPRLLASAGGVVLMTSLAVLGGMAQGPQKPPAAAAGPVAGTIPADMLKAEAFDRITLIDNTVWLIKEVYPRPLPVYDPVKAKADAKAEAKKALNAPGINPKGNVGVPGAPPVEAPKKKAADPISEDMIIELVEGEIRDFKIKKSSLKKIEYFEDLLMAEGDKLVIAKDFAKAFEHYLRVKTRDPKWKGLEERVEKLLFEEGSWALIEQDRERGVRLLRELYSRKADYPSLADKLAQAYGGRINESFDKGNYPYARRVLHDLEGIAPDNVIVREMRARFTSKSKALIDEGMKAEGPARLEKLTESLRVWPTAEGAAEKYADTFKASPTLDVAVLDLPRPAGPFVRSPAGARVARLLYLPLLANETPDAIEGKLPNQLMTGWEIGDIGRRIDLKIKTGPAWSDGSRQVGAMDVVRALSEKAQPRSPGYSARWADLLERVEVTDDQQVTVKFNRVLLQPAAWFLSPVGPGHAAWDGRVPTADGKRKPVGDGPFNSESEANGSASYVSAAKDASSGAPTASIRRIREVRYANGSAALGALVRGEVTLVQHVPPDRVDALRQDPDVRVGTYKGLSLHRLALDGRNPVLRNRSLRRGMALVLNRKMLLEENILRRAIDAENAPSDGPMATDSYANAPNVSPYTQDILLAKMLVAAAKAELKIGAIKLKLEYPSIPEAQAAAPKIAESLRAAGLDITIQEVGETELEEALRNGRKFDIAYRASRCVEPVWEIGPMLCPGFDAASDTDGLSAIASPRIMQLLLQVEHAEDLNSAKALVTQIDRECRDELPVIPLWQIQDHYAYRARLKGPAETADHLYQGIDQWQIEPWFAKDPW